MFSTFRFTIIFFMYNMKQQLDVLERTTHNRLTGDNKITTEKEREIIILLKGIHNFEKCFL